MNTLRDEDLSFIKESDNLVFLINSLVEESENQKTSKDPGLISKIIATISAIISSLADGLTNIINGPKAKEIANSKPSNVARIDILADNAYNLQLKGRDISRKLANSSEEDYEAIKDEYKSWTDKVAEFMNDKGSNAIKTYANGVDKLKMIQRVAPRLNDCHAVVNSLEKDRMNFHDKVTPLSIYDNIISEEQKITKKMKSHIDGFMTQI